ncbi:Oxysterol-binding protein [Xylaria curta]|nr:Oxysterol-binding protein [Xylaria curta]
MSLTLKSPSCEARKEQQHSKSSWLQFIKSIAACKGDLTTLTAPPFLLAPQSMVEYSAYWAEYPSLFVAPALEERPEERALLVLKWFLSTLSDQHASKDENGKRKRMKPLNPFLGELFLGKWEDDAGKTELISEQVSHHPPATAFRVWNETHGVHLEGHVAPKAYFSSTVNIDRRGYSLLHIDKYNETYWITMPKVHVEGLLTFQLNPELSGASHIHSSSGLTTQIEYGSKGWLGGQNNTFTATIHRDHERNSPPLYLLEGQWNRIYTVKDVRGKILETVNLAALQRTTLQVQPISKQHPMESRRAWQYVADAILRNDLLGVAREKSKIENAHRALRKQEQAAGRIWERRYFTEAKRDPVADRLAFRQGCEEVSMVWKFDQEKYSRQIM